MVQGKVQQGHNGPQISLEKANTYFKEIIEKLLYLAEYEYTADDRQPFIREVLIQEHLGSLGYHPNTVMPKMLTTGHLKIKLSEPPGYYLILNGDQEKTTIILPTKKLRQMACRLWISADRDILAGEQKELRFQYLKIIQQKLAVWGYNPDSLIEQMEAKNYLVKRSKDNEPISYWIFKTQKQGKKF